MNDNLLDKIFTGVMCFAMFTLSLIMFIASIGLAIELYQTGTIGSL